VYDIFTYAVPGSLYLGALTLLFARLGWIDPARIISGNTTLVIIALAIASYLIGHVTFDIGRAVGRVLSIWAKDNEDSKRVFVKRMPRALDRPFMTVDRADLQSAIETLHPEPALEIIRLRAVGLMLRNSAPALVLGCVFAIVEIAVSTAHWPAACAAALLLLAAVGSVRQSARLMHWGAMKTFETAFWTPEIDKRLDSERSDSPM
jgi:hypothetical protein